MLKRKFFTKAILIWVAIFSFSLGVQANDTDQDGYPDYFEIEILSQGVVPEEWDLGLVGSTSKTYLYDNYEPFRVNGELTLCEDFQSRNFQSFESLLIPAASQGLTEFYVDYDCDKIKLAANPSTVDNDEGFLDIEYFGSGSRWNQNLVYLNSGIFISRSQSIDLSGYENLYLEVEMKSDFPVLWPFASNSALQLHFIDNNFSFINLEESPYSIGGADLRCFGDSQRLNDSPFDQQDCDYRTYRFPLDSAYFTNLNGVLVSIPNLFDYENCQDDDHHYDDDYYDYECDSLSSKHQIKNIKIIGGDQFPNNPDEYKDPDFDGIGSNQDSDNDNDGIPNNIDSDEYNPAVWLADDYEDIDSDCIPDSVDNDLDSIRDTDCDGLNDDIDTDDDNDSIPDSLIVNVIQDGTVNLGWTPGALDTLYNNNSDCLFESALTAEEIASCEYISLSYNPQAILEIERSENAFFEVWTQRYDELRLNLEDARIALLQVDPGDAEGMSSAFGDLLDIEGEMEDMEELHEDMEGWFGEAFYSNENLGFALNFSDIINIDSVDPASEYLPAGYLEIEVQSPDGFSENEIEIALITSLGEESDEVDLDNFEQFFEHSSSDWLMIKIPLYEFFNSESYGNQFLEPLLYNQRRELSRIKGLQLEFESEQGSELNIRNIRFVISDAHPNQNAQYPMTGDLSLDTDGDSLSDEWETENNRNPLIADYQISLGFNHGCMLDDAGVKCWGNNDYGQTDVPYLKNPTLIEAGHNVSCAIDDYGVSCWGSNTYGELNVPELINPRDISTSYANVCAIDDTGVVCWGDNSFGQPSNQMQLQNPSQISVGFNHQCAIDELYGLACWGDNSHGQTDFPNHIQTPKMISVGKNHSCSLSDSGVTCWGSNDFGQLDVPTLENPSNVFAGNDNSCAIDDSGIVCWGSNEYGKLNSPIINNPINLALGDFTTCALDGLELNCWGDNFYSQLEHPSLHVDLVTTPNNEPGLDGVAPLLNSAIAVNKCNMTPVVAEGGTIYLELESNEWINNPNVTLAGKSVELQMNAGNRIWFGEFKLSNAGNLRHGDVIPLSISYSDKSGMSGSDITEADDGQLTFCDANVTNCSCFPEDISGVWQNANKINAMGVGPYEGDTSYWRVDDFELSRRHCAIDDTYTFIADENAQSGGGFFSQEMDGWTWLESWAAPNGIEGCGVPLAPWDGLQSGYTYKWSPAQRELTLIGEGAHIGIPRIINNGDAFVDGPANTVVYKIEAVSDCFISMNILADGDLWWHFELERIALADGTPVTSESEYCSAAASPVGGDDSDTSGDSSSGSSSDTGGDTGWDAGGDDSASSVTAEFSEAFGGSTIGEEGAYTFPTGAEAWAGFANMNTDMYPLSFYESGTISFTGSVPDGGSVDVRFRLEFNPHPYVDPAYDTETVTVSGSNDAIYTVAVPNQGENTFSSLLMYVVTQDKAVTVTNVMVDAGAGDTGSDDTGSDNVAPTDNDNELLSGDWMLSPTAGSLGVGPSQGNIVWWSADEAEVGTRACLYDDIVSFNSDGSFANVMGADTWLEGWQGAEGCDAPVAPFDGSNASTYSYDAAAGTLTVYGLGAHIGLPKVNNDGELDNVANAVSSITYTVTAISDTAMTLDIAFGTTGWWRYELVCADDSCTGSAGESGSDDTGSDDTGSDDTGSDDTGSDDTGLGDDGSGDAGSDDTGSDNPNTAAFTGTFDGTTVEGNTFNYPSDAASWAGFANENQALFPLSFPEASVINFTASSDQPVTLKFRFEYNPWPDVEPNFETDTVVVDGACQAYSVAIPAQPEANTYSSYLMYIIENDIPVTVNDVVIDGDVPACSTDYDRGFSNESPQPGSTFYGVEIETISEPTFLNLINSQQNSPIINNHFCDASQAEDIDILVAGDSYILLNIGDTYIDAGATACDLNGGDNLVDQDPSSNGLQAVAVNGLDMIDVYSSGIYSITYSALDTDGNVATASRTVEVRDQNPPEIIINGPSTVVVASGEIFEPPTATSYDSYDDATTLVTDIYNTVNTGMFGSYIVVYKAYDLAGNESQATLTVIVEPDYQDEVVVFRNGSLAGEWFMNGYDRDLNWGACPDGYCPNLDFGIEYDPIKDRDVMYIDHGMDNDKQAGFFLDTSSAPIDLRGAIVNGKLTFEVWSDSPDGVDLNVSVDCPTYPNAGSPVLLEGVGAQKWEEISIPAASLFNESCTTRNDQIGTIPMFLNRWMGPKIRIDNIVWKCEFSCDGSNIADQEYTPWVKVDKTVGYDAPTSYEGYDLVWSDEFNGTQVDTSKWNLIDAGGGFGNSELQYYRPENAAVANGLLEISAEIQQSGDPALPTGESFSSAKLTTQDLFEFKHGRVDIRAAVAEGKGMWSAGWMLGANVDDVGWPFSGEIDIVETIGGTHYGVDQEDRISHNAYWNAEGPFAPGQSMNPRQYEWAAYSPTPNGQNLAWGERVLDDGNTFSDTFHVFSIEWDEEKIRYMIDGEYVAGRDLDLTTSGAISACPHGQTPNEPELSCVGQSFNNDFFLILNVAVGGDWPGAPDDTTQFPRGMLVDYVRVYQTAAQQAAMAGGDSGSDEPESADSTVTEITFPELVADTQHVYISEETLSEDGNQLTIKLSYLVDDATLTSLGFELNFDSNVLSLDSVSVLPEGNFASGNLNDNGDALTFTWLDPFGGSWPGSREAELATITFNITEGATGSTLLTMQRTITHPGYQFDGQAQQVDVVVSSYDPSDSADEPAPNDPAVTPINITSTSNAAGFEFVGLNCILSTGSDDTCTSPEYLNYTQSAYVSSSKMNGPEKVVTISYDSDDSTTTGLGLRVHFDSSEMTLSAVSQEGLTFERISEPSVDAIYTDNDDLDNDTETDSYVLAGWASLFGQWPNTNSADLFTLCFNSPEGSNPEDCGLFRSNWDFDQSGEVDALTDGLLLLRYAFGLRGDNLTAEAMAHSSIMTSQEVEQAIQDSSQMNDIDGDGEVNALTDGLLLLRYLFGLRDSNLIDGVISETAARHTEGAVMQHLESHMPSM